MVNSITNMGDVPVNRWEIWQVQMLHNEVSQFLQASDKKQQNNTQEFATKKEQVKQEPAVNKQPDFTDLAEKISDLLQENNMEIQFSRDKETQKMIMKIIDSETKEVVQQFPPEVSLKIARLVSSKYDKGQVTNAKI